MRGKSDKSVGEACLHSRKGHSGWDRGGRPAGKGIGAERGWLSPGGAGPAEKEGEGNERSLNRAEFEMNLISEVRGAGSSLRAQGKNRMRFS